MRGFFIFLLILENVKCELVEQRLAKELLNADKYMKTVSPLDPTFEILGSDIDDSRVAEICSSWLTKIYNTWESSVPVETIVNSAFNCHWGETSLDGSPVNATGDCIAWLRHIYWKDETYPYEGRCDTNEPVVPFYFHDMYEFSSSSPATSSTSSPSQNQRLYYDDELEMLEDLLTKMTTDPIGVEVSMELVRLNSIDLADSSMDTTLVLFYSWNDRRLSWNRTEYGNTQRIIVDPDLIWTPPVEIVNLDQYGNSGIITAYSCKVNYRGEVSMSIKVRASTGCSMSPALYPFDVQQCSIQISTPGMSNDILTLLIDEWMFKNGQQQLKEDKTSMGFNETKLDVLQNVFYNANPAWNFLGYKFDDIDITGNDGKLYSRVQVTFALARNTAFYELTLFMPIGCMCILVILGIWMPVSSGETIGFQVTMLLTMIVYLDVLSSSVPKFEDVSIAPRLLIMFMIVAIGSVLAHIIITMNLWCHDKSSDSVFNFDKLRAKLAYRCAKFFQIFKNGEYNIPKVVKNFVNGEENDKDDEEAFQEAWVFYGKMISHFWGIILSFSIMIAFIAILIDLHVKSAHAIKNIF